MLFLQFDKASDYFYPKKKQYELAAMIMMFFSFS